jgi:threonine synthase
MVSLATAHPAKFPETIRAIEGDIPTPAGFRAHLHQEERYAVLANDRRVVADYIAAHARAVPERLQRA